MSRHRWSPLAALLVALVAVPAAAERTPFKLDLSLQEIVRYATPTTKSAELRQVHAARLAWIAGPDALVGAYIKSKDPEQTARRVAKLGGSVGTRVGAILSVHLPPARIAELEGWSEVLWAEAMPYVAPRLDVSIPETRTPEAHQGLGLSTPYDGEGVILGIIDTGLQWDHEDFLRPNGKTRCLGLWDQQADKEPLRPPEGFTVGHECTPAEMDGGDCVSFDWMGHGTHCCGIMGSSRAPYLGVAPAGEFLVVRVLDFSYLVEASNYIFGKATELGRPAVINMSLGGHDGPHDGTMLQDQALSELTGPGRIILASAGNEGSDFLHVGYEVTAEPQQTRVRVSEGGGFMGGSGVAVVNAWAFESTVEFAVELATPDGGVIGTSDWISGDEVGTQGFMQDGATRYGSYQMGTLQGAFPENGKYKVQIVLQPSEDPNTFEGSGYSWYVKTKGSGSFDAWCLDAAGYRLKSSFDGTPGEGLVPGDNAHSVGSPAAGIQIIAVAAHNTKNAWTDKNGNDHQGAYEVGTIAAFSSRGPSVDPDLNGVKPEISAPGQIIASAASAISAGVFGAELLVDAEHVLMQGTSMSCPHVSGAVALLLQADPELTPDELEEILRRSARTDEFTGTDLPSPDFGYGKLDVQRALQILESDLCLEAHPEGWVYADGSCAMTPETACLEEHPGWSFVEGECIEPKKDSGGCGATAGGGATAALLLIAGLALLGRRAGRRW